MVYDIFLYYFFNYNKKEKLMNSFLKLYEERKCRYINYMKKGVKNEI